MISSIQNYFRRRFFRDERLYYREMTEEDKNDFRPLKSGKAIIYYNSKTREIAYQNPKEPDQKYKTIFSIEEVAKKTFIGGLVGGFIGFSLSGPWALVGYKITIVYYGTSIGSVLGSMWGSIEAYVGAKKVIIDVLQLSKLDAYPSEREKLRIIECIREQHGIEV